MRIVINQKNTNTVSSLSAQDGTMYLAECEIIKLDKV